jgi:hypothetical protein
VAIGLIGNLSNRQLYEQAKTVLKSIRDLMRQYLDPDAAGETEDDDQEGGKTGADQSGYKKKRASPPILGF